MTLFGFRRRDRERDRPARTPRQLHPAVEGCERRLLQSGIVGQHIGSAMVSTDVLGRKH
jgi:hypothetical protein